MFNAIVKKTLTEATNETTTSIPAELTTPTVSTQTENQHDWLIVLAVAAGCLGFWLIAGLGIYIIECRPERPESNSDVTPIRSVSITIEEEDGDENEEEDGDENEEEEPIFQNEVSSFKMWRKK